MLISAIEIGDYYQGVDCNNELISGKVSAILERTVIIEDGTKRYLVKISDLKNNNN